ncbi:MAG TPA: ABC transporter permease, partial [Longimicrobiaceae bacterium]
MDTLLQDVRYALRALRRSPGFALVAVLTLALGIGANTAIFGVVNAVLLRPLPYPEPDALVRLMSREDGELGSNMTPPDFLDVEAHGRVFAGVAAYATGSPTLAGEGEPVPLRSASTSAGFFRTLGVSPMLGRGFRPEDNRPGSNRVVVLGHALWRQHFGGDRGLLGRQVLLNGREHTVVGVMPPGFDYPAGREAWTPLSYEERLVGPESRFNYMLQVVARTRPGTSPERLRDDLAAVTARIRESDPRKAPMSVAAVPLREDLLGDVRTPLLVLLGAVGLVLLVACANVANLLLARAAAREGE